MIYISLSRSLGKSCIFFALISLLFLLIFVPFQVSAKESIKPIFDQAFKSTQTGNFVEALSLWDKVLDLSPDDAAALSNRGNVRLALGDAKGAIQDQTKAMGILPSNVDTHLNRGIAEESLGLLKEAEYDYEWILARNPEDSSALYNLGNLRASQGKWEEAESFYSKASSVKPGFALAVSSKALAQYQLGHIDQAEMELRRIIRKYPMFADARAALTAILWRNSEIGEAESNWAAVAGLDNRYRQSEWLLEIRHWPPEAIQDLMSFLALDH